MFKKLVKAISVILSFALILSMASSITFATDTPPTGVSFNMGQGFGNTTVGWTNTALLSSGTISNNSGSAMNFQIVNTVLPDGNALKMTPATANTTIFPDVFMGFSDPNAVKKSNAFVMRIKTPALISPNTTLQTHIMLLETQNNGVGVGEVFTFCESYSADFSNETTVTFADTTTNRFTNVSLTNSFCIPGNFDGWMIVPFSYFRMHPAYSYDEGNNKLDPNLVNRVRFQFDNPAVNASYYVDNLGFTDDVTTFLSSINCKESQPSGVNFNIGQGFGYTTNGWTNTALLNSGTISNNSGSNMNFEIVNNILPDGNAIKMNPATANTTIFPDVFLGFPDPATLVSSKAFVMRLKTPALVSPNTSLLTSFMLMESTGEVYRAADTFADTTITFIDSTTNTYTNVKLSNSAYCIPGNFTGWMVIPLSYFIRHTAYSSVNGILDPDKVNRVRFQFENAVVGAPYYFDDFGFTNNITDFITSTGCQETSPEGVCMKLSQGFGNTTVGWTNTALLSSGTISNNSGSDMSFQVVSGVLPDGKALQMTPATANTYIFPDVFIGQHDNDISSSQAFVIRLKTPALVGTNTVLKTSFILMESTGEVYRAGDTFANTTVTFVDATTNKFTNVKLTDSSYCIPGNFNGWMVIPLSYFIRHTAYPLVNGVLDINLVNRVRFLFDNPAVGEAYTFDNIGFTDNIPDFLSSVDATNIEIPSNDNLILGQSLKDTIVGWTNTALLSSGTISNNSGSDMNFNIVKGVLPDGNALEMKPATANTYIFPDVFLDWQSADLSKAQALVMRLKAPALISPNTVLKTSMMLMESTGEVYRAADSFTSTTVIFADATTNKYTKVNLSNSAYCIPGNFDGWMIIPFSYFIRHTGYPLVNGTLDLNLVNRIRFQFDNAAVNAAYTVDNIGCTNDVDAFLGNINSADITTPTYNLKQSDFISNNTLWSTPKIRSQGFIFENEINTGSIGQFNLSKLQSSITNLGLGEYTSALASVKAFEWGYSFTHLNGQIDYNSPDYKVYDAGYDTTPVDRAAALSVIQSFLLNQYPKNASYTTTYAHPWSAMNGHYPWQHYAAEMGYDQIGSEIGESINNYQWHIALTRGAARQFNKPWFVDFSSWHSGYILDYASPYIWGTGGPNYGHSLSLMQRAFVMSYMSGADSITAEAGASISFQDYNQYDQNGNYVLSDYGRACQSFKSFTTANADVGTAYTPFGIVLDYYHGSYAGLTAMESYDYKKAFYQFNYNAGDNMTWDLINMFYPSGWEVINRNEVGTMVNGPYGDTSDILLQNASQSTLNSYPCLVLSGNIKLSDAEKSRYKAYVKQGGTLILNSAYLSYFPEYKQSLSGITSYTVTSGSGRVIVYGSDYKVNNLDAIIKDQLTRFMPFSVSANVEYIVNVKNGSLFITLINNLGVTKAPLSQPTVDSSKTKSVTVTYTGNKSIVSVRDIYNNVDITPSSNSATVNVGPGGISVLRFNFN